MRTNSIKLHVFSCALSGLVLAAALPASASDSGVAPRAGSWFTQTGPIFINFAQKSEVRVNGTRVPGAEANPKDNWTLSSAIGYHFTPNFSAQLVLGVTPETSVTNQDGVKLGEMVYGAPSLVFDYRLTRFGAFQPFAGIGAMFIFSPEREDSALKQLEVDNTFGLILRAGAEVMIDNRFGVYFAANKIFADTEASGFLGTAKVDAKLDLDPWILQSGVTYRF